MLIFHCQLLAVAETLPFELLII